MEIKENSMSGRTEQPTAPAELKLLGNVEEAEITFP